MRLIQADWSTRALERDTAWSIGGDLWVIAAGKAASAMADAASAAFGTSIRARHRHRADRERHGCRRFD